MDSDGLATFVAVHRAGGVTAAAEQLHRTQPAISRRVAVLETELGVALFERISGGVVLSEAGRALLPYAERVLAALRDAAEAVEALRRADAGSVSLAVVGTLAGGGLADALKRFSAASPGVDVVIQTATSDGVSELVRRGEATIGLRYFADRSPDVVGRALAPERQIVVCAPTHILASRQVRSLADLAGERWLAFPRDAREAVAETIFAQFLLRGVAAISWTAIDSLTAQKRMVEAGFGVALLQETAVAEELASGALARIEVADLQVAIPIFAITRRAGYLGLAAAGLLAALADQPIER